MYFINPPQYSVNDFYEKMLEGRHDNDKNNFLRTRLLSIKTIFINEEESYKELAENKILYTTFDQDIISIPDNIDLSDNIPRNIYPNEIEKVYSNYFVDKPDSKKIGRRVYDSILSNSYFNLCPYCSHREVKTIDHYLPKTKFISFAITPVNLIPCCSDCNKDKLDNYHPIEDKMLIHPYFEDIRHLNWLKCKIVDDLWPITFSYEVSNTITDSIINARLDYQFNLLKLDKLYADNATREFNKRVKSLIKEYDSNPTKKAMEFIEDNIDTYQSENPNSWQTAMFRALKNSEWFLEEAMQDLHNFYFE